MPHNDGLLASYGRRSLSPAGLPTSAPCATPGVPSWLAALGMVGAAGLAFLAGSAGVQRHADDAYRRGHEAGVRRTPPALFL